MNERYLLAMPSNTLVRDLDAAPPPYGGSGRPPKVPFQRADSRMISEITADLDAEVTAWRTRPLEAV
jgi:hypothetical protein